MGEDTMKDLLIFHAWHNQGICTLTPEEFEFRIAEILQDKPADELDMRLHYLSMAVNIPPKERAEWYQAWDKWEKAWDKWEKAQAEKDMAWDKWEKAVNEWVKARAEKDKAWWDSKWHEWHKKLCHPNCAWTPENRDIFAKGKSLARLLE